MSRGNASRAGFLPLVVLCLLYSAYKYFGEDSLGQSSGKKNCQTRLGTEKSEMSHFCSSDRSLVKRLNPLLHDRFFPLIEACSLSLTVNVFIVSLDK